MLCGNYILSNRSEWTFYFLSSVQFNFTISDLIFSSIQVRLFIVYSSYECIILEKYREVGGRNG
ncbi:hypothetical protein DBP97_09750 [Lactobacillus helveticus]|nr:hypothetical protein [Lactobacillus helveticus]PTS33943.1 hypothetical protein DBP97_09750 [Lactobacillus helveticus]PTS34221.1 hypothetical protein DBQ05_09835 [Lactobacillus helveticus]PTV17080.1 hypothetical protein DB332_09935 [Lactobacillus helveticus]PTV25278.1 hypothetical protein DB334_09960 [Lactobacillus helveticus]